MWTSLLYELSRELLLKQLPCWSSAGIKYSIQVSTHLMISPSFLQLYRLMSQHNSMDKFFVRIMISRFFSLSQTSLTSKKKERKEKKTLRHLTLFLQVHYKNLNSVHLRTPLQLNFNSHSLLSFSLSIIGAQSKPSKNVFAWPTIDHRDLHSLLQCVQANLHQPLKLDTKYYFMGNGSCPQR